MKVHLRMVGCRLNEAEIEAMTRQLRRLGHEIVDDATTADQIIINTCAVTVDGDRASRHLIRQLNRVNPAAGLTVTGCYAQIAPHEIAVLPGVSQVIGNAEKDSLVEQITGQKIDVFDLEPIERDLPGRYARTRAFVKIQDGCDNACTFCVTTIARGSGQSRGLAEVVREIRTLVEMDYAEIVLTGVHLGSYGHDLNDKVGLYRLVQAVLDETDVPRLRLSSLEPWDLSPEFFSLWSNSRLCPHLHLPLQSGSDSTLRRMARRNHQAEFRELMSAARTYIEHPRITSDLIVGFPGETDAEFEDSLRFVEEMRFAGLHVFRYSRRPGTPAARMRGHIAEPVKKARSESAIVVSQRLERAYAESCIGQTRPVLWEQVSGATQDGFINVGYTDNYLRVQCIHPRALTGNITPARLLQLDPSQGSLRVVPETTEVVVESR